MTYKKISTSNTVMRLINAENLVYADKTPFIARLEEDPACKVAVFLRPRRFGKTLFTDMLMSYYDRSLAGSFDSTFKGTWIHEHKTSLAGSYCCVRFDFSSVSGDAKLVKASFTGEIAYALMDFTDRYPDLGLPYSELKADLYAEPSDLMKAFVANFRRHSTGRDLLYVIIDEYDHFANDILSRDTETFRKITSTAKEHEGFIKQFYSYLKEASGGDRSRPIERFFITGVSSVSLDSLTSGFNICTNISNELWCNSMVGFTHAELSKIIDETVDLSALPGIDKTKILQVMEKFYDGYTFSPKAKERIFNSSMCLYFLRALIQANEMPEKLVPESAGADLSKLDGMLRIAIPEARNQIAELIFRREEISSDPPAALNLNQNDLFDFSQAVSMLMYMGYLTIAYSLPGSRKLVYRCPNEICYQVFLNYSEYCFGLRKSQNIDLLGLIEEAGSASLIKSVETIISDLPDSGLAGFNERTLQMCFDFAIKQEKSGLLHPFLEYDTGDHGKTDIYIDNSRPDGHRFVIELKYLSKKQATEAAIDAKFSEAVAQLQRYSAGPNLRGAKPLDLWAVVFAGRKAVKVQRVFRTAEL